MNKYSKLETETYIVKYNTESPMSNIVMEYVGEYEPIITLLLNSDTAKIIVDTSLYYKVLDGNKQYEDSKKILKILSSKKH